MMQRLGPSTPEAEDCQYYSLVKPIGWNYNVITMATRTRIVRIGNSRGIRVPKALLEQAELPVEVELYAEPGRLVVRGVRGARSGWAEAAKTMHTRGEDHLLDEPTSTQFDAEDWQW